MSDPQRDLDIPPFPIEELLTSDDRAEIKASAEDIVASTGEEPVYLSKPEMDERLETLRGFKGSFLETGDPLATGKLESLGAEVFEDGGAESKPNEAAGVGGEEAAPGGGLFSEVPASAEESKAEPKPEPEATVVEPAKDPEPVAAAGADVPPEIPAVAAVAAASESAVVEPDPAETEQTPLPPPVPEVSEALADRRVSLIFFGAGLIGVGIVWALLGAWVFLRGGDASEGAVMPITVWSGLWALGFLVLGFGAACMRRWARTLAQVAGWMWMALGVFAVVALGLLFSEATGALEAAGLAGGMDPEKAIVVLLGGVAVLAIFVPGVMVLYSSAPSVKSTCEACDTKPRWTDRRSPGLLVFGGLMGCIGLWFAWAAWAGEGYVWYGGVVEGLVAQQANAAACGGALVLGVLTLDRRRGMWWVLLVGVVAGLALVAGPWVAALAGGEEVATAVSQQVLDLSKVGGLVIGVWMALLVLLVCLRKGLPEDAAEEGQAGGDEEKKGAAAVVAEGA